MTSADTATSAGVAELLRPAQWDELRHIRGRSCRRWPGASSFRFEWAQLNALLCRPNLADHTHIVLDTRIISSSSYVDRRSIDGTTETLLQETTVRNLLLAGATLNLNRIDGYEDTVGTLAVALERALDVAVFSNLFVSQGGTQAFPAHQDAHDVIVVQLQGTKQWQVFRPDKSGTGPGDVEHDWIVEPHDVLYLPEGTWHRVTGRGEASMHVQLGYHSPTLTEYLTWLVAQQPSNVDVHALSDWDCAARKALAQLRVTADQAGIDRFLADRRHHSRPRRPHALPATYPTSQGDSDD